MTSQIQAVADGIDPSFPVAGQDNDSQGFRDNFGAIKVALTTASNEITNLQLYTAKTNEPTDFQGNVVDGAVFRNNATYIFGSNINPANLTNDNEIQYSQGTYQILEVSTNTTYKVLYWPEDSLGSVRLQIQPTTSSAISISFTSTNGTVYKEKSLNLPYTSTNMAYQFWDIWTTDNGQNTFVKFVGTWTSV